MAQNPFKTHLELPRYPKMPGRSQSRPPPCRGAALPRQIKSIEDQQAEAQAPLDVSDSMAVLHRLLLGISWIKQRQKQELMT